MGFEEKDDDEEFEEKMERLTAELLEQFRKSKELQEIKGAGEENKRESGRAWV